MRPLLALDFDGVVSDSAPESFVVALRTWHELDGGAPPNTTWLESDPPPAREEVLSHPWYPRFLDLMPLGNRAEDYAVVLAIVSDDLRVQDQDGYDARKAAAHESWLARFHTRFYARRHALAERHSHAWHALMGPYPGIAACLRGLAGSWELAIATAKDRPSVRALLDRYGVGDLFSDALLLDKEAGRSKTAHLEELQRRTGTPFEAMLFVDDKLNHLDAVATLGVRCALAAWGYNGDRERTGARDRGHRVLELDGLQERLLDLAGPQGLGAALPAP